MIKKVLVTGGAGYIGSHTVLALCEAGYTPVIVDSLINSERSAIDTLQSLTGKPIAFYATDITDTAALQSIFEKEQPQCVIHFAALKAVGESTEKPLIYYQNNIGGLLSLLYVMHTTGVTNLLFSSSATVYGDPDSLPLYETSPLKRTTNPYGETKQIAERILTDVCQTGTMKSVILRYFNPIGAHSSAKIGELPKGKPNNLVPYVVQAAAKLIPPLTIYGNDYPTPDGTGIRDYIHVVDLADAHVKSLAYIASASENTSVFNVGTGKGTSVLEIIQTFEKVNGVSVPHTFGTRRSGDIASCYANADKAKEVLHWQPTHSLEDALKSSWAWQQTLTN